MVVVLRWVAWAGVTVEHFPCLLSILSFSAGGVPMVFVKPRPGCGARIAYLFSSSRT